MATAPVLGLVAHWESELSKARLAADALRARIAVDPSSVTRSEWADAEAGERFAELALAGAVNAERQAAVAADLARAEELVAELRDTRHADQAAALPALVDNVTAAVDALLAAAGSYSAGIARIVSELGRLDHLPDAVEVERSPLGAKVVVLDGASYRPDRALGARLAMVAVARAALTAGAPSILDAPATWRDLASRDEGVWQRLRVAHPGQVFPTTPNLDAAREARQAERAAKVRSEERRRARALEYAAEQAAAAWHSHGRAQPAEDLIRRGDWPAARPHPWDQDGQPDEALDEAPARINGRPRRTRTPAPTDMPPAA